MLKKIKWNSFRSLGDLELDFAKADGSEYNTIILAGENGTGKTTILDTLSSYLNRNSIVPFDYIEYTIEDKNFHITPDSVHGIRGFHTRMDIDTGNKLNISSGANNNAESIKQDVFDLRHYGYAYSKARSGFRTQKVGTVTTQQLDNDKYEPDDQDNFTRVKQLLIDISVQDDSAWRKSCELGELNNKKFDDFKKNSKSYRFEAAFNEFFGNIRYIGIDNDDPNEKKVLFEKHGKQISVDDLSTGEKQIVFRGSHLLKNTNSISGGIVLIDEPELSMHPVWQKKILDYYRSLFTVNDVQTVQMFIATHSEYVIQSALKDRDNVLVIVLSDDSGKIRARKITAPSVLPTITAAETNYLAFGVPTIDYHIELYGYLQIKSRNTKIADADSYICHQQQYKPAIHKKLDTYQNHQYETLPTYIRNAIDHPDSGRTFTDNELKESIKLLMELCK